jgi:Fic-DOC domain mobile mystery protein B
MTQWDYPDGATPLDPDEAQGLIPDHITKRGELDEWEQRNIIGAIAWLEKTRPTVILNETFIRELHRRMFGKVWRWAGAFRKSDKSIGGPWYQIGSRLHNLCEDTKLWIEKGTYLPDEIAVRFHHRLVQIRPFPNGNGRHARLLTDLLLGNVLGRPKFSWGSANLVNPGEAREKYISALQAADNHDYQPLLAFARS